MDQEQLLQAIKKISRAAKSYTLKGKFDLSVREYKKGLDLLDDPKYDSEFAVMLYAGIGEAFYLQQDWDRALDYYHDALRSEGGLGDPGLHFRLGQIRYEMGNIEKAKDELMRAYMGSGDIIFQGEDPKYFNVIKPHIG